MNRPPMQDHKDRQHQKLKREFWTPTQPNDKYTSEYSKNRGDDKQRALDVAAKIIRYRRVYP